MRREAMYLGHPRVTFPVNAKIQVQSIGSGAKYPMRMESLRGWDLNVEPTSDQNPGFNTMSLLEIWIEDVQNGRRIYGFAKFIQAFTGGGMLLRLVEIDVQNREYLQDLMHQGQSLEEQDAG